MPEMYKAFLSYINKPRGVSARRAAIDWLQKNAEANSVLYFLDDDNTIDARLFEQIRTTRKVSMFPVGLVTQLAVSSPVLNEVSIVYFNNRND